jgi:short subunit dehydrogenase-like uncharacterized protein
MVEHASVLVHGATGFTGKLVCEALARRGVSFAISGRSAEKLASLSRAVGAKEEHVVDLAAPQSIRAAVEGRAIVCACAGPFALVGEPILATCARLGVHYVDTTGEQRFVALAVARYRATAEASGACAVPAMAYEIALADWAAHLAAEAVGGEADSIAIAYATRASEGYSTATTRGTKKSALGVIADAEPQQYVDGALRREYAGAVVRRFTLSNGKSVAAASFPSPEAVVVPMHTGARTVRTFMVMSGRTARTLHLGRAIAPIATRVLRKILERRIERTPEGPEGEARQVAFEIVAEATRHGKTAEVTVTGRDPYGLTAEIQAYAAERAIAGDIKARGVVGPSQGFDPRRGLDALEPFGVRVRTQ